MTTSTQLEKRIARNNQRINKLENEARDYAIRSELMGEWVEGRLQEANELLQRHIENYWRRKASGHLTYKTVRCALSALITQKICELQSHYGPDDSLGVMSNPSPKQFIPLALTTKDTRDKTRFFRN